MGSDSKQLTAELSALSATPRFALLAALSLDRLLPSSAQSPKLAGITLAQLVEAGPKVQSRYSLTPKQIATILKFISALVVRENKPSSRRSGGATQKLSKVLALRPGARGESAKTAKRNDTIHQVPELSSIETEQRLMQAIGKLSSSPFFTIIAESRLADFWDAGWQRAPFEESLTFRQLSGMKVASLLEKRGMTLRKVMGMISSIDRALEAAQSPQIDGSSALAPPDVPANFSATKGRKPTLVSVPKPGSVRWMATTIPTPEAVLLIARGVANEIEEGIAHRSEVAGVVAAASSAITAREIAALALAAKGELNTITHPSWSDAESVVVAASRKVAAAVKKDIGEMLRSWMLALQSAGVPIAKLPDAANFSDIGSSSLIAMALYAIGARNPIVFGQPVLRYWTMQPAALQSVLDAALGALPKSDRDFQAYNASLLPFFDFTDVVEILGRRISYNQRRAEWTRAK